VDGVEEDDGVDRLQGSGLPSPHLVQDAVDDRGDGRGCGAPDRAGPALATGPPAGALGSEAAATLPPGRSSEPSRFCTASAPASTPTSTTTSSSSTGSSRSPKRAGRNSTRHRSSNRATGRSSRAQFRHASSGTSAATTSSTRPPPPTCSSGRARVGSASTPRSASRAKTAMAPSGSSATVPDHPSRSTASTPSGASRRCGRPTPDGRSVLVLSPLESLRRLARLLPTPRTHGHRYHGVLAPNVRLRPQVVGLREGELDDGPPLTHDEFESSAASEFHATEGSPASGRSAHRYPRLPPRDPSGPPRPSKHHGDRFAHLLRRTPPDTAGHRSARPSEHVPIIVDPPASPFPRPSLSAREPCPALASGP